MVAPHRLTPETLLSLPRPGAAVPNPSGTAYIQPYTSFDFGSGRTSRAVAVGSLKKASSAENGKGKHDHSPVVDILQDLRYSDVAWLDDDTLVYLRPRGAQAGHADVDVSLSDKAFAAKLAKEKQAGDAETAEEGQELWCKTLSGDSYRIGEVPVEITDLKTARSSPDGALLAFSAEVYPEDPSLDAVARLDKEYEDKKNGADVTVFDKLYIRHWDTWTTEKRKLVFYLELKKGSDGNSAAAAPADDDSFDVHSLSSTDDEDESAHRDAKHAWSIVGTPSSPLAGFEPSAIECPVRPFGDSSDFDLTASHFAFVSKEPHLPEAWHTRMHVYLVPLRPRSEDEKKPRCLTSQGGARSSPVFSSLAKSGSRGKGKLAWLEMRKDGYEADRNRIIVYDLEKDVKFGISESWELSPGSIAWSEDDSVLFVTAEDEGHKKLFEFRVPEVPSSSSSSPEALKQVAVKPRALTSAHNVSSFHVLPTIYAKAGKHAPNANLLLTMNSLVSPNEAYLLRTSSDEDGSDTRSLDRISNITTDLVSGLSMDQGEEFWFTGADPERQVHGFLLRPHGYDSLAVAEKKEKYGLAFLVHGGPQGAWTDSWSTRWNPNVWAAQGYVVVAINPTGSTGYGQDFTDAINQEWGGKPYKDLVAGLDFVKRVYADLIDTDRMVMLGASYGGYMANWMQGHNDALGFAAIVCHDGILNTTATWFSTEEIYFPEHDLGGTPWEVPNEYAKWSPHNHIGNWRTPQLIIHGGKDYRLPETEGIGVFNALQRRGVPSKLVYFSKENHWVTNAYNSRRWHEEIFSWMEEWAPSGPR